MGDVEPGRVVNGRRALWVAAGLGVVHGAFSLLWAAGGTWLLDTVGQWAVDAVAAGDGGLRSALALVGILKLAGAVLPLVAEYRGGPMRRRVRPLGWAGAVGLVAYGGANTLISAAVLTGLVQAEGGYDTAAVLGHALLWDPLFLAWGLALGIGLALTAPVREAPGRAPGRA